MNAKKFEVEWFSREMAVIKIDFSYDKTWRNQKALISSNLTEINFYAFWNVLKHHALFNSNVCVVLLIKLKYECNKEKI